MLEKVSIKINKKQFMESNIAYKGVFPFYLNYIYACVYEESSLHFTQRNNVQIK